MRKNLIFGCCFLMISFAVLAQEAETCANGAGTVITGAVTGHKYCKSNKSMNWWNANAWCDALGRRLFDKSDCACSNITADCIEKCPELVGVGGQWVWTATPDGSTNVYDVKLSSGIFGDYTSTRNVANYVLCY